VCPATVAAIAADEYHFTLVDAFTPDYGLRECYIYDISDAGVACGTATIQIGSNIGYTGFYWTAQDEKTPVGISWPHGISETGIMAGVLQLYDIPSAQFTTVPMLPGHYQPLILLDVSDEGLAVGSVQICNCSNSSGLLQVPYVWDADNGPRSLPVPGANGAARLNESGLVVGWIGGNMMTDGYVYDLNTGQYFLVSSLFAGPNIQTTVVDVTESGVIAGSRKEQNGNVKYGYTWSQATGVTLLPLPPAGFQPYVHTASLNEAGIVVGAIYNQFGSSRAFVYDAAHGVRDLNTLTTPTPGFTLMAATAVNNSGWIVGYGAGGGGMYTSFVLRPILTGDIDGDGDVDQADLGILLAAFGKCAGDPGFDPAADLDGDGCVGQGDLGLVLAHFGA